MKPSYPHYRYWIKDERDVYVPLADGIFGDTPLTLTGRKRALARAQALATESGCRMVVERWKPGMPEREQVGSVVP